MSDHDETARLAELQAYEIMDTAPEREFDEVVALLSQLLNVPVAMVSLVEQDRQWFKARIGVEEHSTPISQSICFHALQHDGLLEIPDTLEDFRTRNNPICCGTVAGMRFYAGAPLITPAGHKLGTLCALDTRPRALSALQRQILQVMANQVMRHLDLRRLLRVEASLRDEIDHRVKNSLQTVGSLLRIYRSRAKWEETQEMLDAVARRVSATAELHSALYQSDQRSEIEVGVYLSRVIDLLQRQAPPNVRLVADLEVLRMSPEKASAMAVIVSEFSANAFKHAFPDGRDGEIAIALCRVDGDGIRLICSDNGVGSTGDVAPDSPTGIGKRLMEASAEQLEGKLLIAGGPEGYRLELAINA